jgi:NodT family efflux transporter outer membrane factor (OMF) lipoprotein
MNQAEGNNMKTTRSLYAACLLSLAGCAVGPDYTRPAVSAAAEFKEAQGWSKATPADQIARGEWWVVFGDPELNRLEALLNQSNQTIAQAEAQYRNASALVQEAQAAFVPSIGLTTGKTHARTISSTTGVSSISNTYSASLSSSWEVDLWGKLRRTLEAGKAGAEASAANLENIRLSQQSLLAIAYFQLYVSDQLKRSLDASLAEYQREYTIAKNNFSVGVSGEADVLQAQNALETLRTQVTDQGLQRSLLEHSIAVLTGQPPAAFSLSARSVAPRVPLLPPGLPSQLLQRRPDIADAERLVAQANAQIGVARAAYYPDLTLSASGGYSASSLSKWISLPSRVWSVGPSLAASIFDGGLHSAQNRAAEANYDAVVAQYRQTVLTAFQNVEDNLASQRLLQQEAESSHLAVEAARRSAAITFNQYQAGTVSMLNVAQANVTYQTSLRTELNILNSRLTAAVGLIKALGGGYVQPSKN